MAEGKLDFGLSDALQDSNLGPQLGDMFAEGSGREFLPPRLQTYLTFREKNDERLGPKGDASKGEIELLDNPVDILAAERSATAQMVRQGWDEARAVKATAVGIRDENRWGTLVCDPVKFPGGALGTYVRLISHSEQESATNEEKGAAGIAVLPQLEDGRIALMATYRHATRSWALQIPKGAINPGDTILRTVQKELGEETGAELDGDPTHLGYIIPDDGILSSQVPLFFAKVKITGEPIPEESEAIGSLHLLSIGDATRLVNEGKYENDGKVYDLGDSFTQAALFQASSQGLI